MKVIFLDIETVPTDQALLEHGLLEPQLQLNEGDLLKKLSLSATTAKILCLCYATEPAAHTAIEVLDGDEQDIIRGFWRLAEDCNLFVGHNILDFDLRFIYQRSIIHQIKPSRDIPFARFRNAPVYDTMRNRISDRNLRPGEDSAILCASSIELNASSVRGGDRKTAPLMATVYLSCCVPSEILSINEASGFWESPGKSYR